MWTVFYNFSICTTHLQCSSPEADGRYSYNRYGFPSMDEIMSWDNLYVPQSFQGFSSFFGVAVFSYGATIIIVEIQVITRHPVYTTSRVLDIPCTRTTAREQRGMAHKSLGRAFLQYHMPVVLRLHVLPWQLCSTTYPRVRTSNRLDKIRRERAFSCPLRSCSRRAYRYLFSVARAVSSSVSWIFRRPARPCSYR